MWRLLSFRLFSMVRPQCVSARAYYTEIRELPSGKGFADIVYLPRKEHLDRPAMIIELKWDKSADSAIRQIKFLIELI